ncbi:DUF2141 domain-containing protein [Pseudomonas sp. CAU 1711]|uniref:DUF2141 domain-containing protein n=1 Tax=Pseudomonas sp. CAU 1711 TaxID=3140356 RepID=UPI003261B6ED
MPQRILQTVTRPCRLCLLALQLVGPPVYAGDLLVQVEGSTEPAPLHLALVPAEQQDWQPILKQLSGSEPQLRLDDLPPGHYALQLFQDRNGNGKLDLSPRGIPLEPVGFSNNPSLFAGKPKPADARFEHGAGDTRLNVRLQQPRPPRQRTEAKPPRAGER